MRVALFVTCLVDLMRPRIGFAAIELLEAAGCEVVVPAGQTCCGQPAWNSGDRSAAAKLARKVIAEFEGFDHVVAPSGSCADHIRNEYPAILAGDPAWHARAIALSPRVHELTDFLVNVAKLARVPGSFVGRVTYHDSCAGLRSLGIKAQPRALLQKAGVAVDEMNGAEECCGFGGTFAVKMPVVSSSLVDDKVDHVLETGASELVGLDMSCLMNIGGRLRRRGSEVRVRHLAELLAGGWRR